MSIRHIRKAPQSAGKRYTVRLPLDIAALLEALFEMHPQSTRSRLIADVLRLGLDEIQRSRSGPESAQAPIQADPHQPIYLLSGPFSEFHKLTFKHHRALESEHAGESPPESSPTDRYQLGDSTELD